VFDRVFIHPNKLVRYLLDLKSPRGRGKANFFINDCGFSQENPEVLKNALQQHPLNASLEEKPPEDDGWKFRFVCCIQTPSGRDFCITSVWKIDRDGGIPRFITAYPTKQKFRDK